MEKEKTKMNLKKAFCRENFVEKEIFKFDGKNSHANMTKDPSISVKLCRKSFCRKGLDLQDKTIAFRFDFFEIKAPASRRINGNSTREFRSFSMKTCLFRVKKVSLCEAEKGEGEISQAPITLLVTDIGSTTTKALLFEGDDGGYKLLGAADAPTTVEAPTEDVCVGVIEAARRLGEKLKIELVREGKLSEALNGYLSTSSAGGGLQILVSGLARTVTAKSAFRAACAAGGVLLDVLAIDDGRKPHEKVEAIDGLRPDMILLAGGIDGGEVANVVRMASVLLAADLKPKYAFDGLMPVVFAGNEKARGQIEALFRNRAALTVVGNLRPTFERENLLPARRAIHELFTRYVMSRAPGYPEVSQWTSLPIEPTPVAVETMLEIISRRRKQNIIMVDIGGATTDVFSHYDETYNRTVSANLGMSYSASNVLLEAGAENIMRWIASGLSERDMRNIIVNKCIHPTRLPNGEAELEVEQAIAREALRLALRTHRQLSVRVGSAETGDWTRAQFWNDPNIRPEFAEEEYIRMTDVDMLFGCGGVLSHSPHRWQAAMMLVDGLAPIGITDLGLDSVFMAPHLGMLARYSVEAAYNTFVDECYLPLGTCVALGGKIQPGSPVAEVYMQGRDLDDVFDVVGGEVKVIPVDKRDVVNVRLVPADGIDAGGGPGEVVSRDCRGGAVGLIIDARGRPIRFPEGAVERAETVSSWRNSFKGAKQ